MRRTFNLVIGKHFIISYFLKEVAEVADFSDEWLLRNQE